MVPEHREDAGDLAQSAAVAHDVGEREQRPARRRVRARGSVVLAGGVELVEEAPRGEHGAGGGEAAEEKREGVRR